MYPWICQPANQRHFTWIPQLSNFGSSHSQLQYITTHPEKPSSNYHPPPENKQNFLMKNKTPLFNLYKSLDVSQLWWAANTSNLPVATQLVAPALGHWVRYHHSTATFVTCHESCVQHQVCVCVFFRVLSSGGKGRREVRQLVGLVERRSHGTRWLLLPLKGRGRLWSLSTNLWPFCLICHQSGLEMTCAQWHAVDRCWTECFTSCLHLFCSAIVCISCCCRWTWFGGTAAWRPGGGQIWLPPSYGSGTVCKRGGTQADAASEALNSDQFTLVLVDVGNELLPSYTQYYIHNIYISFIYIHTIIRIVY